MPSKSRIFSQSRRTFFKTAAALAAPAIVPASVFGAGAPSNRISVGVIGCGTRGIPDMQIFMRNADVQIAAVCDVNNASYGYRDESKLMGLEPAVKTANKYYAEKTGAGRYDGVTALRDFRELISRDDIDVVAIVTPDHWHRTMTEMAAAAGKDIFCQKPMTLTIEDGQAMIKAVREHNRVFQTGSQYRSSPTVRRACELVLNGRIGELRTIRTSIGLNNKVGPGPGWEPMPVPDEFDYDMWLGPAPEVPYHVKRCIYKFRFILDYSGGQVTNLGAHCTDIAQMGAGTSHTGPVKIEPLYAHWPAEGSLFNTALSCGYCATFENGVELIQETSPSFDGTRFEGTDGSIWTFGNEMRTFPEELEDIEIGPDEIHLPKPVEQSEGDRDFYADHIRNFIDCVKSREDPIEPVEVGHRTASVCHLGNIALRLNRTLEWDPAAERFPDDEEANAMLNQPRRDDWNT